MIEGQHLVEKQKAGVGNAELVGGQRRQSLDLPHRIIGKIAHSAGGERRQPLEAMPSLWPLSASRSTWKTSP